MMIILILMIGFAFYYVSKSNGNVDSNHRKNSVEVSKERYANGEIDDETYKKMLKVISY